MSELQNLDRKPDYLTLHLALFPFVLLFLRPCRIKITVKTGSTIMSMTILMVMFELWIICDKCLIPGWLPHSHTSVSLTHQPTVGEELWAHLSSSSSERAISSKCQTLEFWLLDDLFHNYSIWDQSPVFILATIIIPNICIEFLQMAVALEHRVPEPWGIGLKHSICREERNNWDMVVSSGLFLPELSAHKAADS